MSLDALAVDVNAAFGAERGEQLAAARDRQANLDARITAGTLIPLGGDRYRINDPGNWDNGEVLTMRAGQLLPEHGLDTTTGNAALYSSVPAWHGLGTVVPGGISSVDRVLELARIDFRVDKRPSLYLRDPADPASTATVPDKFTTVRDDTQAALGVVGARYEVLQNLELFEFLQRLVDDDAVVFESAGALREGRSVFVSVRLPDAIRIDAAGVNDEIQPFVVAVNSHDGSSLAYVIVTPWRPVCRNTERFALRDAVTRWGIRHTANARWRLEEARRALNLTTAYYDEFAAEEEALAQTQLELDAFHAVLADLWPAPEENATLRARNAHTRRIDTLTELYETNTAALGATAYAAERAITEYTDWHSVLRPSGVLKGNRLAARATAAIEGTHDDLKTKAHSRLLTLTPR